jgi:hypothetical protein
MAACMNPALKQKYDNGRRVCRLAAKLSSRDLSLFYFIKIKFSSYRLPSSFVNLHENHDEMNVIILLECGPQTLLPDPHSVHTESCGDLLLPYSIEVHPIY